MKFEVMNRWSGAVQFVAEIECAETELRSVKLGLAVRWANKTDLREADLTAADLTAADLTSANLTAANLTPVRDDFWAVLSATPAEVPGLRIALVEGRVDGSTYEGECACLVGTIANVRHCNFDAVPNLAPNSSRPVERFFLAILKGDKPETNQHAKIVVEWIDQWTANIRGAIAAGAFQGA